MSYDLLDKAPKDHMSEEFLQFLRENNIVIYEDIFWLVIANCKYDKPSKRWYTAFFKTNDYFAGGAGFALLKLNQLLINFRALTWLIKAPKDRSVERFHVHLYEW